MEKSSLNQNQLYRIGYSQPTILKKFELTTPIYTHPDQVHPPRLGQPTPKTPPPQKTNTPKEHHPKSPPPQKSTTPKNHPPQLGPTTPIRSTHPKKVHQQFKFGAKVDLAPKCDFRVQKRQNSILKSIFKAFRGRKRVWLMRANVFLMATLYIKSVVGIRKFRNFFSWLY